MEAYEPDKLTSKVKEEQDETSNLAIEVVHWFLHAKRVGKIYSRGDVIETLSDEMDITTQKANVALSSVLGDIVDPVQQIKTQEDDYVGVLEYNVYKDSGAYGYIHFDDRLGKRKRVVCAKCVEQNQLDENIVHATQGEGTSDEDATWEELLSKVVNHYEDSHEEDPDEIQPGASLVDGTTIAGHDAFHAGAAGIGTSNIDDDAITTGELDLSITPTWIGEHQFNAGIEIAEGQEIQDDTGTTRATIQTDRTTIRGDDGEVIFQAKGTDTAFPGPNINIPSTSYNLRVVDTFGEAYKYVSSSSAPGRLELTNAKLDMDDNDINNVQNLNVANIDVSNTIDIATGSADAISLKAPTGDTSQLQINWFHDGGNKTWSIYGDGGSSGDLVLWDGKNGKDRLKISKGGPTYILNSNLNLNGNSINSVNNIRGNNGYGRIQFYDDGQVIKGANDSNTTQINIIDAKDGGNVRIPNGNVEIPSGDLKIGENNSIKDDGGVKRIDLADFATQIHDETGTEMIRVRDTNLNFYADNGQPIRVYDRQGDFNAFKYKTGDSTGTLQLTNANLLAKNEVTVKGEGDLILHDTNVGGSYLVWSNNETRYWSAHIPDGGGDLLFKDDVNTANALTLNQGGNVTIGQNLEISEGQAIQDDDGKSRVTVSSVTTQVRDSDGSIGLNLKGSDESFPGYQILAEENKEWAIYDSQMGDNGYKYKTSNSTPGTLELTNANLDVSGNEVFDSSGKVRYGVDIFMRDVGGSDNSERIDFQNANAGTVNLYANNGELVVSDGDGNITQLT